jgi:hypothetical protein
VIIIWKIVPLFDLGIIISDRFNDLVILYLASNTMLSRQF